MTEPCEQCGELTDDLMAHKMNHALNEGLELPNRSYGTWDENGRWTQNSRNWSKPPDDTGE